MIAALIAMRRRNSMALARIHCSLSAARLTLSSLAQDPPIGRRSSPAILQPAAPPWDQLKQRAERAAARPTPTRLQAAAQRRRSSPDHAARPRTAGPSINGPAPAPPPAP